MFLSLSGPWPLCGNPLSFSHSHRLQRLSQCSFVFVFPTVFVLVFTFLSAFFFFSLLVLAV